MIKTEQVPNPSILKSTEFWMLAAIAIVTAIFSIRYITAPRAIVLKYFDVSDSAQVYSKLMATACREIDERLMAGDNQIVGKFADLAVTTQSAIYDDKQVSEDCSVATKKPPEIGKGTGTNVLLALDNILNETQHLRVQGNKSIAIGFLFVQAAEPTTGQKSVAPKAIKAKVEAFAKENYLVIIGPNAILQGQLNSELVGIPNVKICTFDQGKDCGVQWAFDRVRTNY
jgi:hypothetical protein